MDRWRNEAGEELFVPAHMLLDCTTLHDERRQWCIGGFAWVPVTERLPEVRTEVLVHDGFHQRLIATLEADGVWRDGVESLRLDHVTHWMPLPPLPDVPKEPAPSDARGG